MKKFLCVVVALVAAAPAAGAFQIWSAVFAEHSLTPRLFVYGEVQNRLNASDLSQHLLVRPALGYKIGESHSIWAGYGWTPRFENADLTDEHRFWQQSLASYVWPQWRLSFRFRLEERFIEGTTKMAWRWRELFRTSWHPDGDWGVVLWDEFFFSLSANEAVVRGFDQNRLFLGLHLPLGSSEFALETGYLNQIHRGGATNHAAVAYVFWKSR